MPTATKKGRKAAKGAKGRKAAQAAEANGRVKSGSKEQMELAKQIVALRDQKELGYGEIADQLGIDAPRVQYLYLLGSVKPKDRIKADKMDEDELGAAIVKARDDEEQSWAQIRARLGGFPLGKVKSLYTATKGGRKPKGRVKKSEGDGAVAKTRRKGKGKGKVKNKKRGGRPRTAA